MQKKMLKRAMALSCAFAVSLAGTPETTVSAQNTEENSISTQGIMQTMATTTTVKNETQLRAAIKNGATIVLGDSFKIDSYIEIPKGVSVTIKSDSDTNRVIGASKEIVRLFVVKGSVTFNNITLKGGNGDSNHLTTNTVVAVEGGTVTFKSSKVMLSKGILVRVGETGTVTAADTIFKSSTGKYNNNGGAILVQSGGTFTLKGNTSSITDNPYGGVRVCNGGTFTMSDGSISGNVMNEKDGKGGGVFNNGTFNFNGGTIKGNTAKADGVVGINVYNAGTINVQAGVTLASIYLENANIIFNGAPTAPVTVNYLGSTVPVGTEVAKCASNVNASSCIKMYSGEKVANNPKDPTSIIISEDYTVTTDPGNGQASSSENKAYNDTTTLPSSDAYTRVGYVLSGWQSPSGEVCEPGSTVDVKSNETYTAVWTPKDIAVEYYDENGSIITSDSYKFDAQSAYAIQAGTVKKGYEFLHWKDITDGTSNNTYMAGSAINRTERDDTLKLQAVYKEKDVQVEFNLNMDGAKMEKTSTSLKYSAELSLSDYKPTVTGYNFKGWYTDEKCSGDAVTIISPAKLGIEDTVKLYAKWEAMSITVAYHDAEVPNAQASVKYDETLIITDYAPSKTGYTFKGWYLNNNKTKIYKSGDKLCPKELGITEINLYAVFEENSSSSNKSSSSTSTSSNKVTEKTLEEQVPGDSPSTASGTAIDLKISPTKKTVGVGDKFRIKIDTTEAYDVTTNSNIITIDNLGFVKARAVGTAVVSVNAAGTIKTCTITVKKSPTASTMKVRAKKVKKGKTISVKPSFTSGTYCLSVKYSSSNKKVAKVTSKGKVKGLKKGTAKITIKCSTGAKKVVKIKVV